MPTEQGNPTPEALMDMVKKNRASVRDVEVSLSTGRPHPRARWFVEDGSLYYGWVTDRSDGMRGIWVHVATGETGDSSEAALNRVLRRIARTINAADRAARLAAPAPRAAEGNAR